MSCVWYSGDASSADESEGGEGDVGVSVAEEENDDGIFDGMQPPAGFNVDQKSDAESIDGFSSGISEAGTEADSMLEGMSDAEKDHEEKNVEHEGAIEQCAGGGEKAAGSADPPRASREKKYHLSEEWKKLEALSEKDGFPYTRLPEIVGCSIARHPSGSFWSARYPGEPWHTCKWGPERDAFTALLRIVRHVVKLHIKAAPLDSDHWKAHLVGMSQIDPSNV